MTATEKAHELFQNFLSIQNGGEKYGWNYEAHQKHREMAKKSALCLVKEVNQNILWNLEAKVDEDLWLYREMKAVIPYWKEVEDEINKITTIP